MASALNPSGIDTTQPPATAPTTSGVRGVFTFIRDQFVIAKGEIETLQTDVAAAQGDADAATAAAAAAQGTANAGVIAAAAAQGTANGAVIDAATAQGDITAHAGAASPHTGHATLNAMNRVVQNPTNATTTATASKIPIADGSGKLDTWVSDAAAGAKGLIQLAGQLGGTAASPTVVGVTESGGQALPLGAVADGQFLRRVGNNVVGASAGGTTKQFAPWGLYPGSSTGTAGAGRIRTNHVDFPLSMNLTHFRVRFGGTGGDAADRFGLALYTEAGARVAYSAATDPAAMVSGNYYDIAVVGGPVAIPAGGYIAAWGSKNGNDSLGSTNATPFLPIANGIDSFWGFPAETTATGEMPATLTVPIGTLDTQARSAQVIYLGS